MWLRRMIARFLPIPRDDRPIPRRQKAAQTDAAMREADRVVERYRELEGVLQLWVGRRR